MPSFRYRHIGVSCEFEAKSKTEDELMKKIAFILGIELSSINL